MGKIDIGFTDEPMNKKPTEQNQLYFVEIEYCRVLASPLISPSLKSFFKALKTDFSDFSSCSAISTRDKGFSESNLIISLWILAIMDSSLFIFTLIV